MRPKTKKFKPILLMAIKWIVIAIGIIWVTFPIIWALTTSFKSPVDILRRAYIPFIQYKPVLDHWYDITLGNRGPITLSRFTNSLIVALCTATISTLMGLLAAFALARWRYDVPIIPKVMRAGNNGIAGWILAQRYFPPPALIIPFFLIFHTLGLIDTYPALIIADTMLCLPFTTWVLREFIIESSQDVERAALLDGLSWYKMMIKIVVPMIAPGLLTCWIFSFIFTWNDFFAPLVLTYTRSVTLPIQLAGLFMAYGFEWWTIAAYCILTALPPLILTYVAQRYIVRGLTLGAVK